MSDSPQGGTAPLAGAPRPTMINPSTKGEQPMQVYAVIAGTSYEGEDFTTLRLFDCKSSAVAYVAHLEEHFDYAEMELRDVCMESALACAD